MEETRSEQLAQKVTPTVRGKLDEILKKMGHYDLGKDGHVKWDQSVLEEIIAILEEKYIMDGHDKYAEVVRAINQYTALINTKLVSLIGDLDTSEARIRSEYEKQISSKDAIIKDLQDQKKVQEMIKNEAVEDASKSKNAQTIAEKQLFDAEEKVRKAEDTVKDKESIIQMLTSKLAESEDKLSGYDTLRSSEASFREQVTLLQHQKEMLEAEMKHVSDQHKILQSTCEKLETQLTGTRNELSEIHDQYQSLERDLLEQKRITEQAQELAVERAVAKTQIVMQEQLAKLRDEKTRLEVQLELLQKDTKK